jgi:hypothetical protein
MLFCMPKLLFIVVLILYIIHHYSARKLFTGLAIAGGYGCYSPHDEIDYFKREDLSFQNQNYKHCKNSL